MRPVRKLTTVALAIGGLLTAACTDPSPTAPRARADDTARLLPHSLASIVSTTVWDFVALAGGDSPQGPVKTFTIAGAGSVVASVSALQPNHGFEPYTNGFAIPVGSDERGLGLCGYYGAGGACVTQGGDLEIGDTFTDDVTGLKTVVPSLFLNFTGLTAGSVVTSVDLASVQLTEGYSVSWSSDGSTYTLLASALGTSSSSALVTLAVPSATRYLRFDAGSGGAGNNYLVASVTTVQSSGSCPTAPNAFFQLGSAGAYSVLGLTNGNVIISEGATKVAGDVGVGPNDGGALLKATIMGKLVLDPTAHPDIHPDLVVKGGTFIASLTGADADARAASTYLAGLAATQSYGDITTSRTFTSTGSVNVITLKSVNMVKQTLTISGGAGDVFVFNVTGGFNFSSSQMVLSGVAASNIIWNFTGGGDDIDIFKGVTSAAGIFLAPQRNAILDVATLRGALIAGGTIKIHSAAQVLCP